MNKRLDVDRSFWAGSSGANPFACIAAGIACLWGPAHGGANEEALMMLKEIGSVDRIPEYVQGVKDRKYRLMGFGHRVYKNYDPRAAVMQKTCHEVLEEVGEPRGPPAERLPWSWRRSPQRSLFRRPQALSKHRLLFGHYPQGHGFPQHHVHRALRAGALRWGGSANGKKCSRIRSASSAGRGSSTPDPSSATIRPSRRDQ